MRIPGFDAEAAVYRNIHVYSGGTSFSQQASYAVIPQGWYCAAMCALCAAAIILSEIPGEVLMTAYSCKVCVDCVQAGQLED